jgi:hypothetical protein
MPSKAAPFIAAGGAIIGTWLLERLGEASPSSSSSSTIAATRTEGLDAGLQAAARSVLACGTARLSNVRTIFGAPIRTLPSGAGEDFVREFVIQRSSLTRALGDLAIPGVTNRPRLSPPCAQQWLELWLDAFEACNRRDPDRFGTDSGTQIGWWPFDADPSNPFGKSPVDWRTERGQGKRTELGRAVDRCRGLYEEARALAPLPGIESVTWLRARKVTEAIQDMAIALDRVGFKHDVAGEALAALRRDLHPIRVIEKAVDVAVTPIELALDHVVGPTLATVVGALAMTLGPWLVVGGAVYLIVRRGL